MNRVKEQIIEAFKFFTSNISDKWILENLSLPVINSKFNKILNQIKNGKSNNGTIDSKRERLNRESQAVSELIQELHLSIEDKGTIIIELSKLALLRR